MTSTTAVFGLYATTRELQHAVDALCAARFRATDISVMYSESRSALRSRRAPAVGAVDADGNTAVLGNILTALSGIAAVALQDDGPFTAGGPIVARLTNLSERLDHALILMGVGGADCSCARDRLLQGELLLSVECDDALWAQRAREILAPVSYTDTLPAAAPTRSIGSHATAA